MSFPNLLLTSTLRSHGLSPRLRLNFGCCENFSNLSVRILTDYDKNSPSPAMHFNSASWKVFNIF